MRKKILSIGTIFFVLLFVQCKDKKSAQKDLVKNISQSSVPKQDGSILVVGVRHDKSTNCFFDEKSKQQISSIFDSIVQIANKREIVVVSEDSYFGEEGYLRHSCYPSVFKDLYIVGAETRSPLEKKEFIELVELIPSVLYRKILVSRFDFFGPIDFHSESVRVKASLNIKGVASDTMRLAERFREINESFESKMTSVALTEKAKGNFVIVFCGGMHAVSLNQSHGFDFILTGDATKDENLKMFLALKIFQALADMKNENDNQKTTN